MMCPGLRPLLASLLCALPGAAWGAAGPATLQAHTALAHLATCLPLADGSVFTGGEGGLAWVDLDAGLQPKDFWTALDGLPGTRVHALWAAGVDTVYVGTEGGLARLVRRGDLWRVSGTSPSKPVRAIVPHDGALWLATWGGGLLRVDERTMRSRSAAPAPANLTAAAVFGGQLMVATAEGTLQRLSKGRLQPLAVQGLPQRLIWHLRDSAQGLLVGTVDGLYNVAGGRARRLADGDVRATTSHLGKLVVASRGSGLRTLSGGIWGRLQALRSVQGVGAAGRTLCAATNNGLWLHRHKTWQRLAMDGLPEGDVSALAWHEGELWAGTYHRGLTRRHEGRWQQVGKGQIDRRVNALASATKEQGGRLWAATARGLFAIDGQQIRSWRRQDGLPADDVHSLVVLRDGAVIAGTASGAARVRGDSVQLMGAKQGLPLRAVWALAEDRKGGIWLGSSWGLYSWSKGKLERFSMATGHLSDDWVTALATGDERIWVGTYRHGIDRLDRQADGSWQATPLGGGWINLSGLRVDGPTLYAATMDGLLSRPVLAMGMPAPESLWRAHPDVALGRDVTATLVGGGRRWVASRRGIVGLPAAVTP